MKDDMAEHASPNAATRVFNIPELLELILTSLPLDGKYWGVDSSRFLLLAQTTSRTWRGLLHSSMALRSRLYLSCAADHGSSAAWLKRSDFRPGRPNPWTVFLLKTLASVSPLATICRADFLDMITPMLWTYALQVSRVEFEWFPPPGPWLDMLAASPPFTDMFYTRYFDECGSGRTYVDYQPRVPMWEQQHVKHRAEGITLGDIVDAVAELMGKKMSDDTDYSVHIQSIRRPRRASEGEAVFRDETNGAS